MRTRLSRYVLTEVLGPLGLGLLVYTFILLLRFLFQSAEMIIRRGLPASIVGELLLLTLPNIVVLTLPMSLLFGVLIAAGRLSSDSEVVAMRACGVSLLSLYRPILLLSLLLTGVNTLLMVYTLPWGNHSLQLLRLRILTQSVSQQVQPRVFYEEWKDRVLYVFEVRPGEKIWRGVFLAEAIPAGRDNMITIADEGEVRVDPTGEKVVLHLTNAQRHKVDLTSPDRHEVSRHRKLDLVLEDQFTTEQRAKVSVSKGVRELTLEELQELARDPQASAEQTNLAQVEIHKKFSIPAACLVFGLFALPLGINSRRGGKASGFALSIGVIVVYYVLLSNGEEAARFGRLPPWLGMWLPNLVLSALGFYLLLRRNRDRSLLVPFLDRFLRRRAWGRLGGLRRRGSEPRGISQPETANPPRLRLRLPRFRIPFPNLLDRYVARLFVTIFLLTAVSGLAVFILFDLSENFDEILKNKVGSGVVLSYYKYLSLQMFYEIAPILVLVTTLITFSLLARTSEIIACKSLGLSLYRLALPALTVTAAVALFSVFLQSSVLPASNAKVAQLKDRIRGRETPRTYRRADRQWLFGQGRYIYNYIHYDERRLALQRLQVFDFDERHRLRARLFAADATFKGEVWVFSDGWAREFDGDTVVDFERFDQSVVARYPETPDYFDSEIRPPEQLRYGELQEYIADLERSGQSVPELRVELYNKIAFPAVSFIMALVGLPFAFRLGRQGALYGIGLSVVLGMIFMMVFAVFSKIGEAGALPPAVAVWSPAALFALLGGYLFLRVRT